MQTTGNISKRHLIVLGLMLVFVIEESAVADCPNMSGAQGARLIISEKQTEMIAKLIPAWKSDEPARLMKFGAYVSKKGRIEGACCLSWTHHLSWVTQKRLTRLLTRLRFVPARHKDESLRVFVDFTIVATRESDGVRSELVLNHLIAMDELGLNYSAPQRLWTKSMWAGSGTRRWGDGAFTVETMVDKFGRASNANVRNRVGVSTEDVDFFARKIAAACFIPGFYDGKATEMLYSETFTN